MDHPLQCRCGTLKGRVSHPRAATRAICYCKDCQAYAHFLGRAADVLNAQGGTQIVATLPAHVQLTHGLHALTAVSLSDKGLLRWYAGCCGTPIGNTPRDPHTPYVGLVSSCFTHGAASLQDFGPVRAILNPKSATAAVGATPGHNLMAMLRLTTMVIGGRLRGSWRDTPFFSPESGAPVVRPQVFSSGERAQLTHA